jgi:hypothetical protein
MARWQTSTPFINFGMILARYLGIVITWKEVAFANLICSLPYFFFDRLILVNFDNWLKQKLFALKHRLERKYA